jgi:hypothetical protein
MLHQRCHLLRYLRPQASHGYRICPVATPLVCNIKCNQAFHEGTHTNSTFQVLPAATCLWNTIHSVYIPLLGVPLVSDKFTLVGIIINSRKEKNTKSRTPIRPLNLIILLHHVDKILI